MFILSSASKKKRLTWPKRCVLLGASLVGFKADMSPGGHGGCVSVSLHSTPLR